MPTASGAISNTSTVIQPSDGTFDFGPGTDGDATISGNTNLTRNMYYNTLTINSGIVLGLNNYKIYAKISITNNGTIHSGEADITIRNGANASGATQGLGGASAGGGVFNSGSDGGNGGNGTNSNGSSGGNPN